MNDANFTAYILDQLSAAERAAVEAASRDENITRSMHETAQLSRLLREHRAAEPKLEASPSLIQAIQMHASRSQVVEPLANEAAEAPLALRRTYWRSTLVPVALAASVLLNVVALTYLLTKDNAVVQVVDRPPFVTQQVEISICDQQVARLADSVLSTQYSPENVLSTRYSSPDSLPQEPPITLDPRVAAAMGIDADESYGFIDPLERRQLTVGRTTSIMALGGSVATAATSDLKLRDNAPLAGPPLATSSSAPRESGMTYGPPVVDPLLHSHADEFLFASDIPSIGGDALAGIRVEPKQSSPQLQMHPSSFGVPSLPSRFQYDPNTTGELPSVDLGRILARNATGSSLSFAPGNTAWNSYSDGAVACFGNGAKVVTLHGINEYSGVTANAQRSSSLTFSKATGGGSRNFRSELGITQLDSAIQGGHPSSTISSLTKVGAGTLTLSGQNAYTGGTTISAGAVRVATGVLAADASPANIANNLSLQGGTMQFNSADAGRSVRQSKGGVMISDSGTILGAAAAAPQAASAPSPAATSNANLSGAVSTYSGGTLKTQHVQLGVTDKFQYAAPHEAAPGLQVPALAKNEINTQSIVEQQILPLITQEQLLVESLGEDHPKVKVVRKQIKALQDLVSRPHGPSNEAYESIHENPFEKVTDAPLSTFSIDVDTASYSNMRRFLTQRQLPPADAVRIEELLNYFTYNYPQPTGDVPFSVTTEVARCPWNAKHQLVRIGLKGREIAAEDRPASNLVFLLDVSGSMADQNKLPLVKQGMRMLVRQLTERDRVAIVTYAGASGLALPSTTGDQKDAIIDTLGRLQSGGSTNGGSGLQLAYDVASEHMIRGGINRVILCTDGDFNVGITDRDELVRMIETKAKSGVQLSVLGFGMGNYKDATLEKLADKGDGNYAYIDTELEARKVLVDQLSATLITIAKDVKIQIEFNPARVASYRLLGYENRMMAAADFNNDKKDAGEIGAGHTVTALYEVVTEGVADQGPGVDPLKYQPRPAPVNADLSQEMLTLKLRYKLPGEDASKLIETPLKDAASDFAEASKDFKFSASVAAFGMLLRQSRHAGDATLDTVITWATDGRGSDLDGYREEFLDLVRRAKELKR